MATRPARKPLTVKLTSQTFFRDLEPPSHRDERPSGLAGKLDEETRSRLERLRRGE